MREPKIENKYNLTPKLIPQLKILKPELIKEPYFWRNNVIKAWCLSGNIVSSKRDPYGTFDSSFWLGIYDKKKKDGNYDIKFKCSCMGDMCSYKLYLNDF